MKESWCRQCHSHTKSLKTLDPTKGGRQLPTPKSVMLKIDCNRSSWLLEDKFSVISGFDARILHKILYYKTLIIRQFYKFFWKILYYAHLDKIVCFDRSFNQLIVATHHFHCRILSFKHMIVATHHFPASAFNVNLIRYRA